jgi:hypothetical protein
MGSLGIKTGCTNSPFFSKGDKGGFSEHLDGNRSWSLVE